MVLDFVKGKYGLQLILLLFVVLVSGLIFQLLGMAIIGSVFNFDISSLTESNSSEIIMEAKNGYWIFFILMLFNSLGMFVLPSLVFANLFGKDIRNFLSLGLKKSLNFLYLLPLFALAGVIVVGFMGELNMKLNLPEAFHVMEEDANQLIHYILSFKDSGHVFTTIILMAVLPAIGEELFFRGVMQKILIKWTKENWVGILITAFIFSAIHMQFLTFLPRFFMGIMLGYLFVWSRNLFIPILAHFLHNLISIVVSMYSENPEMESQESINIWIVLISAIIISVISYRYYSLSKKINV